MPASIMVFTRDLRIRDNPALAAAVDDGDEVVPLFVLDDAVLATAHGRPNRLGFLLESLTDLDRSLRGLGGALVLRRGSWVDEVLDVAGATGALTIHLAEDHSSFARARLDRLTTAAAGVGIEVHAHPGITVVAPGVVVPKTARSRSVGDGDEGGEASTSFDEYKVFTPYHRAWLAHRWRDVVATPSTIALPDRLAVGSVPPLAELSDEERSPDVIAGGETAATRRLKAWARSNLREYDTNHDDLAGDRTSRISADLHLGCLSPLEVATRLRGREGAGPFVRQLCWRDFYHQILAARPDATHADYRDRGDRWNVDAEELQAWKDGRTGYPIVDAGMRQLRREGFMHNRARMVVASFLVKDLYLDWRLGAAHFLDLLVDGDLANNQLNWQWVAGTGSDTNPNRVFNPLRQAERFDPRGDYIRRYVPELAGLSAKEAHDPPPEVRAERGYPQPIVDHAEAVAAYRSRRS
jgi:deoxyribodipyrimidine photo-lyase